MRWWLVVLAAGCGDPDRDAAALEAKVAQQMDDMEGHASEIRDAVVRGDLPSARSQAGKLAAALPELPPGPPGSAEALKLALADISGAATLGDAAAGVGRLVATCAACHTAETVGTAGRPVWNVAPTKVGEMARHAHAVDQLWVAALRGSDADLTAAVAALDDQAEHGATGIDRRLADLGHAMLAAPPAERGAGYAQILAMCGTCHAANRPPALPKIDGVTLPGLQPQMDDHFVHALELQLAVIGGDLDAAHHAGAALRESPTPTSVPDSATPYLAALNAAADRASVAPTLAEAAKASADLALVCGSCHVASGGGPKDTLPAPPGADDTHMGLHLFGAYWMGYGLFAPDERAWRAGATALAKGRMLPEGADPSAAKDDPVHALATKALTTADPAGRAALWAELMQTCAPCHAQLKR